LTVYLSVMRGCVEAHVVGENSAENVTTTADNGFDQLRKGC
jgi:hypothetical protein